MGSKQKRKLVRMDPWINAMTVKKQRKLVIGCTENMQQQQDMSTQEFILKIKFDKDQNFTSKDMKMIFIVVIQKQDGNIIFLLPPRVLLHHPGGDHPTAGGQHGIGTLHHGLSNKNCSVSDVRFSHAGSSDSRVSDGSVHRIPSRTHFSHAHSLSGSVVW